MKELYDGETDVHYFNFRCSLQTRSDNDRFLFTSVITSRQRMRRTQLYRRF